MSKAAKVAREDVAAEYVARIRKLVEDERVGGARRLVDEALREIPDDPLLLQWKEVLSPGRVLGTFPAPGYESGVDYHWLEEHGRAYQGQWVAVLHGQLLAHAPTLPELSARLQSIAPQGLPLVQHIEPIE